jgi:hypothetical protein
MTIPLINKTDNFEIIRDKIAEILAVETVHQQAMATADGHDPADWRFLVYAERANPWELFRDGANTTPIVNVCHDDSPVDLRASNLHTRQRHRSRYNIDCYAYSPSVETAGGHVPGDESSAKLVQGIGRMIRNVIMHDDNRQLELPTIVQKRHVSTMMTFQPRVGNQPVQHVMGFRVVVESEHNETTDQFDSPTLDIINIQLFHEPDGQVIAELDYEV